MFEYIRTYFTLALTTFKVEFVSTAVSPLNRAANSMSRSRTSYRQAGLVVKASAPRAAGLGSILALPVDLFPGLVISVT